MSKKLSNIHISSSGTKAAENTKGHLTWYALRLLYRNNLLSFMKTDWTQTTANSLKSQDKIICIGKGNYQYCENLLSHHLSMLLWDIPDFDDGDLNGRPFAPQKELAYLELSEKIYTQIVQLADSFIKTQLT